MNAFRGSHLVPACKSQRLLFLAAILLVCVAEGFGQMCAPPPAGLVGWWPGDSAQDVVAGNNGTLSNSTAYVPGMVGWAFSFNGSNSGVALGNTTALQLQNFTIEAWIKRGSNSIASFTTGGGEIFSYGGGGYSLGMNNDGSLFLTRLDIDNVTLSPGVTDTNWHHLAVTKAGTNVLFYIDGVGHSVPPYSTTYTFSTLPAIGTRTDVNRGCFLGIIDEVGVYNRPLASNEIAAIYNAGSAGKCLDPTAPSITTQPADQILRAGSNAALTVLAAGSWPLSYRWLFYGSNLPAATSYMVSFSSVQLSNQGPYLVIITNANGAVTSRVATLTVQNPPAITTQPQGLSVFPGSNVLFTVGASGTPPLSFQWRFNGTNLAGSTHYALLITNAQVANAGPYTAVVTNAVGAVTSSPAVLVLKAPPIITTQPLNLAVPAGVNASFSVAVSGPGPFYYQWRFYSTNLANATSATVTLTNVQNSNAGPYSVTISNLYGVTASAPAMLSVTNPVCVAPPAGLVGWWPGDSTHDVVAGNNGTIVGSTNYVPGMVGSAFSFNGNGNGLALNNSLALQLQDFTIEAWVKRASSSIATYDSSGESLVFSYGASGYGLGVDNSGRAFLTQVNIQTVKSPAVITDTNFHHVAVTKAGSSVIFYIDGASYPATSFIATFAFSTIPGIGMRADSSRNSFLGAVDEVSVYNRTLSSAEVQSVYYATSEGKCAALSWLVQPTNQTTTLGSNATFTAAATGTAPITYQWYFYETALDGATNLSLTLAPVTLWQAGTYSVAAANPLGRLFSSNVILTARSAPLPSNGSFETGNASGWVLSDLVVPLTPLAVQGAGFNAGFGFFSTAPTDGSYCLAMGFDGDGPGRIRAAFDVNLPPSLATLTFTWRAGWDMLTYPGSTLPRTFGVTIEPFGGGNALQTYTVLTALPGTANYDTGNQTNSLDLSAFSGRAIRVSFDANIP